MADANYLLGQNIELILKKFDIEYVEHYNRYSMACPIHGGDNKSACVIYKSDEFVNFKCFTHDCHNKIGCSFFNFVRFLLNKSAKETIDWVEENIGKVESFKVDNFYKNTKILTKNVKKLTHTISMREMQSNFVTTSDFYIKKGYSKEVLEKYWVGVYSNIKDRITVPVFDTEYTCCVGYSSRSLFKQCCICDQYHNYNKPCPVKSPKWKHSYKFSRTSLLYNQWAAKGKTLFLVEGPADVWRMVEAGFSNVVGLFGAFLTEDQKILLESSGATNIVTFLDPDEAGIEGAKSVEKYCKNMFNYHNISYHLEPADCTEREINKLCTQYC